MAVYAPISNWTCSMRAEVCKPSSPCFPNGLGIKQCIRCSVAVSDVWTCVLCDEYIPGEATYILIGNLLVCFACLKSCIDALIESEATYPLVYGGYMIHPVDLRPLQRRELPGEATCVPVGKTLVCFACLKSRLDALIESEANYPPVYGGHMIHPWDFDPAEELFGNKEETVAYFHRFIPRRTISEKGGK